MGKGGPLAFLNKKTWHPGNARNQEEVWKREQVYLAELSKAEELKKQIADEREKEEWERLAETVKKKKTSERVEWMYQGGFAAQEEANKRKEDMLLGKHAELPAPQEAQTGVDAAVAGMANASVDQVLDNPNESWARLNADPLLWMKREEQSKVKSIVSNPYHMMQLKEQIKRAKQEKKAKKEKKHSKSKSRKADKRESPSRSRSPPRKRSPSPPPKRARTAPDGPDRNGRHVDDDRGGRSGRSDRAVADAVDTRSRDAEFQKPRNGSDRVESDRRHGERGGARSPDRFDRHRDESDRGDRRRGDRGEEDRHARREDGGRHAGDRRYSDGRDGSKGEHARDGRNGARERSGDVKARDQSAGRREEQRPRAADDEGPSRDARDGRTGDWDARDGGNAAPRREGRGDRTEGRAQALPERTAGSRGYGLQVDHIPEKLRGDLGSHAAATRERLAEAAKAKELADELAKRQVHTRKEYVAGKMTEEEIARRRAEMMENAGELDQHRTHRLVATYEQDKEDGKGHLQAGKTEAFVGRAQKEVIFNSSAATLQEQVRRKKGSLQR